MMKRNQLILTAAALLSLASLTQTSEAHGPYIRFGIGISPGFFYGPGPYYYGYPYGYPYYYAPPPAVVYETTPRVIVRQSPPPIVETVPPPAPSTPTPPPPPPSVIPIQNSAPASPAVDALMAKLSDTNEMVRRDAAMDLGRMKEAKAVDALIQMMSKDASPIARDGATRALGLIAAPRSLNALIYAAQADNDRDVRHSAQFAVEIIRTNLRN